VGAVSRSRLMGYASSDHDLSGRQSRRQVPCTRTTRVNAYHGGTPAIVNPSSHAWLIAMHGTGDVARCVRVVTATAMHDEG
jgi:hypothetical protein